MLPSLSNLNTKALCQPCTPVDALLEKWSDRDEELTNEQLERLWEDYNDARTECAICFNQLSEPAPRGGIQVIAAVDKDISCGHAFHKECLMNWFRQQEKSLGPLKCPLCSQKFVDAKIDALFNRIDGVRKRDPQEEANRINRVRNREFRPQVREALEWPLTYDQDPLGWAVVQLYPGRVRIKVPQEHVLDWKRYSYERFIQKYNVDTLTFDQYVELLAKSDKRRSLWVGYYVIVWELQMLKEGVVDEYDVTKAQTRQLLKDVKDSREQGNSWKEIFLALTLGIVPEGTPQQL
jgi:hypothetical protein